MHHCFHCVLCTCCLTVLQVLSYTTAVVATKMSPVMLHSQILQSQLSKLDKAHSHTAAELSHAPLNLTQRSQVRDMAADTLRDTVPTLVAGAVQRHVPSMIEEVGT